MATEIRIKINKMVAHHLLEALSWCFYDAEKSSVFEEIKNAETHDEMLSSVKSALRHFNNQE